MLLIKPDYHTSLRFVRNDDNQRPAPENKHQITNYGSQLTHHELPIINYSFLIFNIPSTWHPETNLKKQFTDHGLRVTKFQ